MTHLSRSRAPGRSRRRTTAAVTAAATVLSTVAVVIGSLGSLSPAAAALAAGGVGPLDPANSFPSYYQDTNGIALELCQDGLPNCLAGPEPIQDVHAAGGDAEAFYYAEDATTSHFVLHNALEAAYAADGPEQEVVFQRTQVTARAGGLPANTRYTVTDPYGSYTCTTDAEGSIRQNACRIETTPVAGEFNRALGGRLGPFLTWDTFAGPTGAPPAGFIGDNTTPHKVVGSPTGFNSFRVSGPGLAGTCINADGSTVASCEQTDLFIIQGKVVDTGAPAAAVSQGTLDFGDVPGTPPVTKTLTYANTGSVPVTVGSVDVAGANASAFAPENTCPVAPATVDVGTRCTIGVTFTPEPGKSSAATLTITDDTPVSTRNIALKGSNLGVMVVSDPAPPAGLVFPTTPVGTTSLEDNVVIGNTGNGPLTIASTAVTGASAAHYRLVPNSTCSTPVDPDGGCEIGVQFAPTSTGSKTANLRVTDSTGKIVNVPLTGVGGSQPVPGPPAIGPATAGNASARVSWTAPTSGGTPTGYTVSAFANGATTAESTAPAGASATSLDIAGLTNGTSYRFSVTATNGGGTSSASALSNAVTPSAPDTTPPTVTAQAPAAGATNIPVAGNVTATFSEGVQGVSGTTVLLRAAGSTTNVPATVTYNAATRVATLDPTASLANGTQYTVTLSGGASAIRDSADNALATTTWSFTTAAAAPNPAPTVTARAPAVGSTAVGVAGNITATFSEAVNGVGTGTFQVRNPAGSPVAGTVTRNGTTNQWILNPSANLAADTRYTVTLTGGASAIRDLAGAPLTTTTWSFLTGPAPTVTARTPAVNATTVGRTANVTATFSEPVAGVSGSTVTVRNAATGALMTAVVSYNATSRVATLNPSATLAANTRFRVDLVGGATSIRDSVGNPLTTVTWNFTTGAT